MPLCLWSAHALGEQGFLECRQLILELVPWLWFLWLREIKGVSIAELLKANPDHPRLVLRAVADNLRARDIAHPIVAIEITDSEIVEDLDPTGRRAMERQFGAYKKLIEVLNAPTAREYYRLFPARKKTGKHEKDVKKKAQEIARYVLPVATFAYLYHTVNGITLLRYWRACRQHDAPLEQRLLVGRMVEELLKTWREINANPAVVADLRKKYNLLADLPAELEPEVVPYYVESVPTGAFPNNGGSEQAAKDDFEFYALAGQIEGDPKTLKVEDFWTFDPLNKALAKVGTQ